MHAMSCFFCYIFSLFLSLPSYSRPASLLPSSLSHTLTHTGLQMALIIETWIGNEVNWYVMTIVKTTINSNANDKFDINGCVENCAEQKPKVAKVFTLAYWIPRPWRVWLFFVLFFLSFDNSECVCVTVTAVNDDEIDVAHITTIQLNHILRQMNASQNFIHFRLGQTFSPAL